MGKSYRKYPFCGCRRDKFAIKKANKQAKKMINNDIIQSGGAFKKTAKKYSIREFSEYRSLGMEKEYNKNRYNIISEEEIEHLWYKSVKRK